MEKHKTESGFTIRGRIDAEVHSVSVLREESDREYENLSKKEKLKLSRNVSPEYDDTFYNVTTDRLHEYFVDNLDRNNGAANTNVDTGWLVLGDDKASGISTSDTTLNNRIYKENVTDIIDNGKGLLHSTFIDSSEANSGGPINELGIFTGDPANIGNSDVFMANHAGFSSIDKDNTKTVVFDVTLSFSDT